MVTVTPVNLGGTGEIAGHTCDFRTGQPLSGVTVASSPPRAPRIPEILTDDTGAEMDFAGLPGGDGLPGDNLARRLLCGNGRPAVAPGQVTSAELTLLHEFSDVPPSFWVYAEVGACVRSRIVSGYADGSYGAGLQVTRNNGCVHGARDGRRRRVGADRSRSGGLPRRVDRLLGLIGRYRIRLLPARGCRLWGRELQPGRGSWTGDDGGVRRGAIVTPRGEAGLAHFTPPATPSFLDVPTTFWSFKHIEYIKAAASSRATATGPTTRSLPRTRDQMAATSTGHWAAT